MDSQKTARKVKRQHQAVRDDIGDLITRRPLPSPSLEQVDPFLFLNHHGPQVYPPNNGGLPFGPHPHRGFETVTFILEGELAHLDSSGHESIIRAGGVQWMTAGRGIVHSEISPEEFKRRGGSLEILQLWVNLPSRLKMTLPRYVGLQREQIPVVEVDEGRVRIQLIAGEWEGKAGPVQTHCDVQMMTITCAPGGAVHVPVPPGRNVFLYVVRGNPLVSDVLVRSGHLVELDDDGDAVEISATDATCLLFGHAQPIAEPVVAHGPFVMCTPEEIVEAIRDYREGKFGELPSNSMQVRARDAL